MVIETPSGKVYSTYAIDMADIAQTYTNEKLVRRFLHSEKNTMEAAESACGTDWAVACARYAHSPTLVID